MEKTIEQLLAENDALLSSILSDLKEINANLHKAATTLGAVLEGINNEL